MRRLTFHSPSITGDIDILKLIYLLTLSRSKVRVIFLTLGRPIIILLALVKWTSRASDVCKGFDNKGKGSGE